MELALEGHLARDTMDSEVAHQAVAAIDALDTPAVERDGREPFHVQEVRAAQVVVSTSCSLLHTPIDLEAEPRGEGDADLDDELRSWMAFAVQKVGEVATLARGLADGREAIADESQHPRDTQQMRVANLSLDVRRKQANVRNADCHREADANVNSTRSPTGKPSALYQNQKVPTSLNGPLAMPPETDVPNSHPAGADRPREVTVKGADKVRVDELVISFPTNSGGVWVRTGTDYQYFTKFDPEYCKALHELLKAGKP